MMPKRSFAEALGAALEPGPSRTTLAAQRPRVIAAMQAATRAQRRRSRLLVATTAIAAVALMLVASFGWRARVPRELTAVWNGRALAEHQLVAARGANAGVLHFSDGTRVELVARAELTLSRLGPTGVDLSLESGLVRARVAKGTGRTWTISAGPYRVQVVGTTFSVEWDAASREIDVHVSEGRVLVFGLELPASGLVLDAGARFHGAAVRPLVGASSSSQPEPARTSPAAAEAKPRPVVAPPSSAARASASQAFEASRSADWRALAAQQRYAEALAQARELGFERLFAELNDKDLLLLANTARYAGAIADAQRALMELRQRYPRTASATVGALVLAGIHERAKNGAEAARWLRTFLAESPDGELSAGARARLLGILVRTGQRAEARRVATDYLRYHPNGPYVSEARGVLESGTLP